MSNTPPKIRSMPGQNRQLSTEELAELRLRQQALMMSKATYLLAQSGYEQYVEQLMASHGIVPEAGQSEWGINMGTGEIVRKPLSTVEVPK